MHKFINFKLWIENSERKTFNNVRDAIKHQIHPIKIKNNKEINTKRLSDYDIKLLYDNIINWKMFEELSPISQDEILTLLKTKNGTLADIINLIVNDHKN